MKSFSLNFAAALLLGLPALANDPVGYPPLDPAPIYRAMDRDALVRAYSDLHPEAAFMALFNSYLAEGSAEQNVGIMETSVDI